MDVYLQFQLYYADEIPKMQLWLKEKESMTNKAKRKEKSKSSAENEANDLGEDDTEKSAKDENDDDGDAEDDGKSDSNDKEKDGMENDETKEDEEADDEEEEEEKRVRKVPRRRDFFTICKDNGLGSLVKKFGLTPEQFAENLRDNYQRHEPGQVAEEPEELAEQFICKFVPLILRFCYVIFLRNCHQFELTLSWLLYHDGILNNPLMDCTVFAFVDCHRTCYKVKQTICKSSNCFSMGIYNSFAVFYLILRFSLSLLNMLCSLFKFCCYCSLPLSNMYEDSKVSQFLFLHMLCAYCIKTIYDVPFSCVFFYVMLHFNFPCISLSVHFKQQKPFLKELGTCWP